jgi:hypothetical protein
MTCFDTIIKALQGLVYLNSVQNFVRDLQVLQQSRKNVRFQSKSRFLRKCSCQPYQGDVPRAMTDIAISWCLDV